MIVPPDLDLEIRKALHRAARRIALRLFLCSLVFKAQYLALQARYALLRGRRKFLRIAADFIAR
ncbi:MAG: hypothetical protein KGI51_01630 [Rhodospirillales bacterium]|nr:hypothetical protein [Rhodospirillales bacterium]